MHCLPVAQLNVQNGAREGKGEEGKGREKEKASHQCAACPCLSISTRMPNCCASSDCTMPTAATAACGSWHVACTFMWQVNEPTTKYISSLSRRLYAKTFTATRLPIYYWLATCHMPQAAAGRQRFYAAVKKFHAKLIMFMQRHLHKQRQKAR